MQLFQILHSVTANRSLWFILIAIFSESCWSAINFEDVSNQAGITNVSRSFGAAWGDFNSDGYVDLYSNNHQNKPSLYLNQKDGTFVEVYDQYFSFNSVFPASDQHGAAWGDFDNDGDQDLIVLVGGNGGNVTSPNNANHFYINYNSFLIESAAVKGVDLSSARGRSPLWLDYDHDGFLDLAVSNLVSGSSPITTMFNQQSGVFVDTGADIGFQIPDNTNVLQLTDINNSGHQNITAHSNIYGVAFFDNSSIPFTDLTTQVFSTPLSARGAGTIFADFNNDQLPDMFIPLGSKPSELTMVTPTQMHFGMYVSDAVPELGFNFNASSIVNFEMAAPWHRLSDVYIGSQGINPTSWTFSLDPADTTTHGLVQYDPAVDRGIYIGYDPATLSWKVVLTTNVVNLGALDSLLGIITSNTDITNATTFGFDAVAAVWNNKLLMNSGNDFINQAGSWGVNEAIPSISAVAADFDNDMDLDLYVVNSLRTANYPNRLYENVNGSFVPVTGAGGAEGSIYGIGQNVVTADYDQDGFLDLYVMNGGFEPPFSDYGNHQLFHNVGNTNHWLEIDLEGVESNRDAIGAKVIVTTNGITQWREQNGQMHYYSQNHKRLHFGLAANTVVDEIKIIWPNGLTQILNNIPADQIIHVVEEQPVDVRGMPVYNAGLESGVFIWKDYFDEPYHLRSIGDGRNQTFDVSVLSDKAINSAVEVQTEIDDVLTVTNNKLLFHSVLTSWVDGVDFNIAPASQALLTLEHNNRNNPDLLYIGNSRKTPYPSGWIINSDMIGGITDFVPGQSVMTRIGANTAQTLNVRTSANRFKHSWTYKIFYENRPLIFDPVYLESGDTYQVGDYALDVNSVVVGPWKDGFNISFPQAGLLGIRMKQDGIFQPHHGIMNYTNGREIKPNAISLPVSEPYGIPPFSITDRAAVYMWKDSDSLWHIRFKAAGAVSESFTGQLTSSEPFTVISTATFEVDDTLSANVDSTVLDFSVTVDDVWYDEIVLQASQTATFQFDLIQGGLGAGSVFIGKDEWPVRNLPVELTGW